jgi:hypothetical protein
VRGQKWGLPANAYLDSLHAKPRSREEKEAGYMRYREVAQAVAGGRFASNVKGEVRRVKISLFALRTSNFVYLLPARYPCSPPSLSSRLRVFA